LSASEIVLDLDVSPGFFVRMNCIFCRIAAGEAPTKMFFEDEKVMVFYDRAPLTPLHLLVCPKTHYRDFLEAPPEVHQMLAETVQKVIAQLGDRAKDFRLMINNGPRSGQTVFHLHYHILAGK
jgi:histidine triad (HIT) family protein